MLAREDHNEFSLMMAGANLAEVNRKLGNLPEAESLNRESLALARELGDQRWTAINLNALGKNALEQGDWASAERYAREALVISHSIHSDVDALGDIACLAQAWAQQGQSERSLRALLYVEQHPASLPYDRERNAQLLYELRMELPPGVVEQAASWCSGRTMDEIVGWIKAL
jgi:hypothetical protein